ncbi:MAG TPA: hypothetical protein VKC66_20910 [Xanthobacteraceae bacterium]|nr:hypothetical protein [Xanthobacteraceae bacterium]
MIDVYRKRSVLNQALHLYERINLGNWAIVASCLNPMIRHQDTGMKITQYTAMKIPFKNRRLYISLAEYRLYFGRIMAACSGTSFVEQHRRPTPL